MAAEEPKEPRCTEVLMLGPVRCYCEREEGHAGAHEARATAYDGGQEYQVKVTWYRTPVVKH